MILRLWSSEPPYEIEGTFWKIRLKKYVDTETGIGYIHKPFQQPHPPIAVPAMSRNSPSMRTACQRGYQPFGHCLVTGNVLADFWTTYEAAAFEAGRQPNRADWKVCRSIFLADSTPEARRRAQAEFGSIESMKESYRDRRGLPVVEAMAQDLRQSLRMLRRAPAIAAIAVLTLAMGVGATTAVFSVVYSVLLQPLPFPEPQRLVQLWE